MNYPFSCCSDHYRLRSAGVPCPEPIALRSHVLLMKYIGDGAT